MLRKLPGQMLWNPDWIAPESGARESSNDDFVNYQTRRHAAIFPNFATD